MLQSSSRIKKKFIKINSLKIIPKIENEISFAKNRHLRFKNISFFYLSFVYVLLVLFTLLVLYLQYQQIQYDLFLELKNIETHVGDVGVKYCKTKSSIHSMLVTLPERNRQINILLNNIRYLRSFERLCNGPLFFVPSLRSKKHYYYGLPRRR